MGWGDTLVSRPVTAAEYNEEDRDGFGKRDIHTFFEDGVFLTTLNPIQIETGI